MTPEEFRGLLAGQTDVQLLEPCLHGEAAPYVFEPNPETWDTFRDEFVDRLGVARADIRIVGSGRLGFSLTPGNALRPFTEKSDIDVAIVSSELFDQLWIWMLEAAYPRPPFTNIVRFSGWLKARRGELYTGWFTPGSLRLSSKIFGAKARPVIDFNARWFNALQSASRYPPRRHAGVTGRLYRTWRHAELYHLYGLAELRRTLE